MATMQTLMDLQQLQQQQQQFVAMQHAGIYAPMATPGLAVPHVQLGLNASVWPSDAYQLQMHLMGSHYGSMAATGLQGAMVGHPAMAQHQLASAGHAAQLSHPPTAARTEDAPARLDPRVPWSWPQQDGSRQTQWAPLPAPADGTPLWIRQSPPPAPGSVAAGMQQEPNRPASSAGGPTGDHGASDSEVRPAVMTLFAIVPGWTHSRCALCLATFTDLAAIGEATRGVPQEASRGPRACIVLCADHARGPAHGDGPPGGVEARGDVRDNHDAAVDPSDCGEPGQPVPSVAGRSAAELGGCVLLGPQGGHRQGAACGAEGGLQPQHVPVTAAEHRVAWPVVSGLAHAGPIDHSLAGAGGRQLGASPGGSPGQPAETWELTTPHGPATGTDGLGYASQRDCMRRPPSLRPWLAQLFPVRPKSVLPATRFGTVCAPDGPTSRFSSGYPFLSEGHDAAFVRRLLCAVWFRVRLHACPSPNPRLPRWVTFSPLH